MQQAFPLERRSPPDRSRTARASEPLNLIWRSSHLRCTMAPLGAAARQPLSCVTSTRAVLRHLHRAHDGARDATSGSPFRVTAPEFPRAAARCAPHTRLAPHGIAPAPLQRGVVSSGARWAMSEGRRTFTVGGGLRAGAEDPFRQQVRDTTSPKIPPWRQHYTASQNLSPKSTALASQSLKSIGCHGGTLSGNLTAEDQPVDLGETFWLAVH